MKRQILFSVLLLGFTSLSYAESQPSKGAEGIINSGFTNRCFKPKSKYVQQVCTDYEIRYKLWSLMGEPVGNYVLNWKLSPMSAITIKGVPYNSFDIPEPLKKSVEGLELYIDGSANVIIPKKYGTTVNFHRFNTGVAVKANKGSSYNTPGSPNWNKTFIESKACSKTDVKYATVEDAKDAFINGFTLSSLEICSGTEVYGVSYIDNAIEQLCRSDEGEKYKFCPKKDKKQQEKAEDKKQSDPIDDAFAKLDNKSKKKINAENSMNDAFSKLDDKMKGNSQIGDIDSQFEKAEAYKRYTRQCQIKMQTQNQCIENSCKAKPSEKKCLKFETIKSSDGCGYCPEGKSCLCIPSYESKCISYGANPLFSEWQSCQENAEKRCLGGQAKITDIVTCVKDLEKVAEKRK